jgi:hypothetical protein
MSRLRSFLPLFLFLLLALAPWARLHAQATRTWVSGVGDDANPCSRTAPGRTFALAQTLADGEIDALDPGSFGTVTVTQGLTLDGCGTLAQVAVTSGPGIVVNAPGAVVVLRNLVLTGLGSTTSGIHFQAGSLLIVEHCRIQGFAQSAIQADASAGQLVLRDVTVTGSPVGVAMAGSGLTGSFEDLVAQGNLIGLQVQAGSLAVTRSQIAGNASCGIQATGGTVTLSGCLVAGNGGAGVQAASGATVRAIDTGIYDNGAGFENLGGILASAGGNRVAGNARGSAATTAAIALQ